ncbi:MAG: hydroxymethylglutaryl-CoA reductase [Gemmatimonadota bacterium]|nr:MAG: hydroxymethylglutaryl-CoA reductase [Gemmatimonadota bacterium]
MTRSHSRLARINQWTENARLERLHLLRRETDASLTQLATPLEDPSELRGQIENYVGVVRMPVGVAGPLAVCGEDAVGTYYVPLATTEGTLVLAVTRGAEVITSAGGASVHASDSQVTRAPLFVFPTGVLARAAGRWVIENFGAIRAQAEATTRHGQLLWIEPITAGRRLVLEFTFRTGDAAGQNMVTFAADAACCWLRGQPLFSRVEFYTLESNLSHDKKIANLTQAHRRGRQVNAEVTIPRAEVVRRFRADPQAIARVALEGAYSSILSGAVGAQAQFANVLAALFVATGQDVATVTESGTGLTVIEETAAGDLYASVTIPNLLVGSVGGGTRLPSQRECLDLIGCAQSGSARKLAEIAGAAVLAGELALVAALASDTFAQAHAAYGRPRKTGTAA